jgi:hypothetical protein
MSVDIPRKLLRDVPRGAVDINIQKYNCYDALPKTSRVESSLHVLKSAGTVMLMKLPLKLFRKGSFPTVT